MYSIYLINNLFNCFIIIFFQIIIGGGKEKGWCEVGVEIGAPHFP